MKNRIIQILVFLCIGSFASAQTATLRIEPVAVCAGSEVFVPVRADNLNNVEAITLVILFDNAKTSFQSLENISPLLPGLTYQLYPSGNKLGIGWSALSGATFSGQKLFDIRFSQVLGNGALTFDAASCELVNNLGSVIPLVLNSGMIGCKAFPVISRQPENISVIADKSCSFEITSESTLVYSWQESRDNGVTWSILTEEGIFSGTNTAKMTISKVPLAFNGFLYSCSLDNSGCNILSLPGKLSVSAVSVGAELGNEKEFFLNSRPNPFTTECLFEYKVPEMGMVSVKIFDITGKALAEPVKQYQTAGIYRFLFDGSTLGQGIYICRLSVASETESHTAICKIVKKGNN